MSDAELKTNVVYEVWSGPEGSLLCVVETFDGLAVGVYRTVPAFVRSVEKSQLLSAFEYNRAPMAISAAERMRMLDSESEFGQFELQESIEGTAQWEAFWSSRSAPHVNRPGFSGDSVH